MTRDIKSPQHSGRHMVIGQEVVTTVPPDQKVSKGRDSVLFIIVSFIFNTFGIAY